MSVMLTVTAARPIKVSVHVSPKQITKGTHTAGGASLTRPASSPPLPRALEPRTPSHCKQFSAALIIHPPGAPSYADVPLLSCTPNTGRAMITDPRKADTHLHIVWTCENTCKALEGDVYVGVRRRDFIPLRDTARNKMVPLYVLRSSFLFFFSFFRWRFFLSVDPLFCELCWPRVITLYTRARGRAKRWFSADQRWQHCTNLHVG